MFVFRRNTKLVSWMMIVVLLGLAVVPVGAQDRDQQLGMVETLRERGLLTELGESQTVGNTTITLDWGYADERTVMIMITVYDPTDKHNNETGTYYVNPQVDFAGLDGAMFQGLNNWANLITLADGQIAWQHMYAFQLKDAMVPDPDFPGELLWVEDYLFAQYGADLPETLDFTLQVAAAQVDVIGDGPRFGIFDDAPYQFALELPLHRAVTVAPNLTQTDQALAVSVETVTLTLVSVKLRVCSDLPDGGDWFPVGAVTFHSVEGQLSGRGMVKLPTPEDVQRCFDYEYRLLSGGEPGMLTFAVDKLTTSEPETREFWDTVAAELAQHDVIIEVVLAEGHYYDLVSKPDDMTDEELYTLLFEVRENALPVIAGSWVFEVEIPGIG